MTFRIEKYESRHVQMVRDLNDRVRSEGISFPENPIPKWLPKAKSGKIFQDYWVVIESESLNQTIENARGAFIIKYQEFSNDEANMIVGDIQLPLSEGIVNSKYANIGVQIVMDATRKSPYCYALGMGGEQSPLAKLLAAFNWYVTSVPFYFYIVNIENFLTHITILRNKPIFAFTFDLFVNLKIARFGWLFVAMYRSILLMIKRPTSKADIRWKRVDEFDEVGDIIWESSKREYKLVGRRDTEILNILYPKNDTRFIKLVIYENNEAIGWAVLLATRLNNHKQFGSMKLGSLVDCLASPGSSVAVCKASKHVLLEEAVDLMVSNQMDSRWGSSLKKLGFSVGPSNFALALSRKFLSEQGDLDKDVLNFHFNRGDGDGPINL